MATREEREPIESVDDSRPPGRPGGAFRDSGAVDSTSGRQEGRGGAPGAIPGYQDQQEYLEGQVATLDFMVRKAIEMRDDAQGRAKDLQSIVDYERSEGARWKAMVRQYQERDGFIAPGAAPFMADPIPSVADSGPPLRCGPSPPLTPEAYRARTARLEKLAEFAVRLIPSYGEHHDAVARELSDEETPADVIRARDRAVIAALDAIRSIAAASVDDSRP